MPSIDRDRNIIRHMLKYCDEVETAHDDFSHSKEKFMNSSTCVRQVKSDATGREKVSRLGTKNEPLSTPEKSATLSLSQELREVAERCYEWLRYSISKISLKMKT